MAIYIKQGDTETLTTNPIKTCDGVGIDLSDAVVKLIIKENMEDPDENAILLKSLEHPESNIVSFQLSADETAAIMIGQYVIGIKIYWDNGIEREIYNDILIVEKGVFSD